MDADGGDCIGTRTRHAEVQAVHKPCRGDCALAALADVDRAALNMDMQRAIGEIAAVVASANAPFDGPLLWNSDSCVWPNTEVAVPVESTVPL